ncbi:MAG: type VI secretion system baseplate subunit TssF [Planctomycetaceae bacterium]|nr:type VI secretion system baseplate subunit TssF [Planctomycetaceae bacterium]
MSEALDAWYQRELDFFRETAAEFAERFPKIANRLNLSATDIRDPHVERLSQGFAYLNARTRHKLDDSFPELADAMLGVLYPHMTTPVPSMSILRFGLNRTQKDQTDGFPIPAGRSLETEPVRGHQCRFRTCYPLQLFPLSVDAVRLIPQPFSGPSTPEKTDAEGALRFEISAFDPRKQLSEYRLDRLRFFINISNFEKAARLLEFILTQCAEVVICGEDTTTAAAVLPPDCIRPVGFSREDAVLPDNPRSFPGYRMLTEYFVFPRKFLFFEVTGLSPSVLARLGNRLQISLLLREFPADLENDVSNRTVVTGCTPVINLFYRTADGIPLTHRTTEYRIIPDARAESAMEVHSISEVRVEDDAGRMRPYRPFYSVEHGAASWDVGYWHATRRPGPVEGDSGLLNEPTQVYLTLVDPQFTPQRTSQGTLHISLMCFNRDMPEELARQRTAKQIQFDITGGRGPVSEIECLVPPTPTCRRHLGRRNLWPLISQLSLNHLSLMDSRDGLDAFREILVLNDVNSSRQTRNLVNGLKRIHSESAIHRMGAAFARGTRIQLLFENENFAGDSAYLFACVLNNFLAMYTAINSFVQLTATTTEREAQKRESWTWTPQTGNRPLI